MCAHCTRERERERDFLLFHIPHNFFEFARGSLAACTGDCNCSHFRYERRFALFDCNYSCKSLQLEVQSLAHCTLVVICTLVVNTAVEKSV